MVFGRARTPCSENQYFEPPQNLQVEGLLFDRKPLLLRAELN